MSYRGTPYQSGYGGHASMSMPMPGHPNQPSYSQPYPATSGYTRQTTPYPVSTSTASMSSEIDTAIKQLTDDLKNSIINSARNEDLEGLIENEGKLNELIMDSQITKDLKKKREDMTEFNKDQAVTNLSMKPEFETLKVQIAELSQRQNELRDSYLTLQTELGNTSSLDTIFAILQAAASEKETISDQIKSDFYDGDITIDEFIKRFVEERKLYQLRKIKSDKITVLMQNLAVPGVTNMPRYPVSQSSYQMNQPPPYPPRSYIPSHRTPHPPPHPLPHSVPPSIPQRGYYGGYHAR